MRPPRLSKFWERQHEVQWQLDVNMTFLELYVNLFSFFFRPIVTIFGADIVDSDCLMYLLAPKYYIARAARSSKNKFLIMHYLNGMKLCEKKVPRYINPRFLLSL